MTDSNQSSYHPSSLLQSLSPLSAKDNGSTQSHSTWVQQYIDLMEDGNQQDNKGISLKNPVSGIHEIDKSLKRGFFLLFSMLLLVLMVLTVLYTVFYVNKDTDYLMASILFFGYLAEFIAIFKKDLCLTKAGILVTILEIGCFTFHGVCDLMYGTEKECQLKSKQVHCEKDYFRSVYFTLCLLLPLHLILLYGALQVRKTLLKRTLFQVQLHESQLTSYFQL